MIPGRPSCRDVVQHCQKLGQVSRRVVHFSNSNKKTRMFLRVLVFRRLHVCGVVLRFLDFRLILHNAHCIFRSTAATELQVACTNHAGILRNDKKSPAKPGIKKGKQKISGGRISAALASQRPCFCQHVRVDCTDRIRSVWRFHTFR